MTKEVDLLARASCEIKNLRSANQLMGARLDMFDKCVMLLTANVQSTGGGMSPDITSEIDIIVQWEIGKEVNKQV